MILHMDMDAFFAAIEQRDRPESVGRPLVVGGSSTRSVVATANYEARRFGIHSAMPMFMALEKCPHLMVIPPDKPKYAAVSGQIMALLNAFTPLVEPVSIDEAFLDITGCGRLFGSVEKICAAIKGRIKHETGLTCSIGASHLRFLAKIASDMNKPDGIHIIEQADAPKVIQTLAIQKVPGVGERAMGQMERLGIRTLGDVSRIPHHILEQKFGKFAVDLSNFSRGIDPSTIETDGGVKSISSESTLENDTLDTAVLKKHLLAHAQRVGRQLRAKGLAAANITIKIKFSDFTQITRQKRLKAPVCASTAVYREACDLFEQTPTPRKIRLTGVGVSSFSNLQAPVQLELFDNADPMDERWAVLDRAVDRISRRFGPQTITSASLK